MSLPISVQTESALENIITTYDYQSNNEYRCYFPMHYSTSMHINNYLLRFYPYTNNQIKCQSGKFEEPSRQIDNIQEQCALFKQMHDATMELIPEFYFIPEMFMNINFCYFGKLVRNNKKLLINNIKLGKGFKSVLELIYFHQNNLNSEQFSSQIHKWIDNIFGENQITEKENVYNSYPFECYEKYVREEIDGKLIDLGIQKERRKSNIIKSRVSYTTSSKNLFIDNDKNKSKTMNNIKNILMKTYFYGQCPSQLFSKSHPPYKKAVTRKYSLSNIDTLQLSIKNDYIILEDNDLLYINESFNGNYLFILTENNIIVYNKFLKLQNNLSIYNIGKIFPPFSFSYNTNVKNTLKIQYMFKYLIFEILECKYFFVAGYLDNSFRIYSKEKDKNIIYSIYTESKVTCIRKANNANMFLTGHQNGKIIKWKYSLTDKDNLKKDNKLMIYKKASIYSHQSFIKIMEINEKHLFLISVGEDEIIYIRKLYDFELLSYIKLNKKKNQIIDINLHNQLIILSSFKPMKKTFYIYIYSLNGMKLGKFTEQIKVPISIIPEFDEIITFGSFNIYLVTISMKEKTSLITISNDLTPNYFKGEKTNSLDEDVEKSHKFNEDLYKETPISYFYDIKYHALFCLFSNGRLHRVNLIKNM